MNCYNCFWESMKHFVNTNLCQTALQVPHLFVSLNRSGKERHLFPSHSITRDTKQEQITRHEKDKKIGDLC